LPAPGTLRKRVALPLDRRGPDVVLQRSNKRAPTRLIWRWSWFVRLLVTVLLNWWFWSCRPRSLTRGPEPGCVAVEGRGVGELTRWAAAGTMW
jgi:hypothetical protein